MPVNSYNTDPLQDYVIPNVSAAMTVDGLVVDGVYAYTGVIDTLGSATNPSYLDPSLNQTDTNNSLITLAPNPPTSWISARDFGGTNSIPIVLTYNFSINTYYNAVSFNVLNVPCTVKLLDNLGNQLYTATVEGGNDILTTTDWQTITYNTIGTQLIPANGSIQVVITRNVAVQQIPTNGGVAINIPYSVGIEQFSIRLNIVELSDATTTGSYNIYDDNVPAFPVITTQNALGFTENYQPVIDSVGTLFGGTNAAFGTYWKCAPQPVKDAVVYFYTQIGTNATLVGSGTNTATMQVTPSNINRMYTNPLYSNCRMNLYYTNDAPVVPLSSQIDTLDTPLDFSNCVWYPVQRDFILRKGFYEFPTINASYLKLEFTELSGEVYDLATDTIPRVFNAFPYWVEQYYENLENTIQDINSNNYTVYSNNDYIAPTNGANQLSTSTIFGLGNTQTSNSNNWPSLSALNNSQLDNSTVQGLTTTSYVSDPSTSYKLLDYNGVYNNASYNQFLTRRFPYATKHQYQQINVNQTWNQAYFTGLQSLSFYYQTNQSYLSTMPTTFISKNGTNSGFTSQSNNYVLLNTDEYALTPFFNTLDGFSSFKVAGLTNDWNSFLTDSQTLMTDSSVLNYGINSIPKPFGKLGSSRIILVSGNTAGQIYGLQSGPYPSQSNLIPYYDANFISVSGYNYLTNSWVTGPGVTTSTGTTTLYTSSGISNGVVNSLTFSGATNGYMAYNFPVPNIISPSGLQSWKPQLGYSPDGTVGMGSYVTVSGNYTFPQYYFLIGAGTTTTSSGKSTVNDKLTFTSQFINPTTGSGIAGTTVTGTVTTITSGGYGQTVLSGTMWTGSVPSNTIQLKITSSGNTAVSLYQLGAFNTPTNTWISTEDRSNMRVSGVARVFLPSTNNGTYKLFLNAVNIVTGSTVTLVSRTYAGGSLPIQTWIDLGITSYTPSSNYTNFNVIIEQVNTSVNEPLFISMFAPFYFPVRYEYSTNSSSPNWTPIVVDINNPNTTINIGTTVSGIQLRLTALTPNTFASGVTIVPVYSQSPYYTNIDIDYIGSSKNNESYTRLDVHQKPYFLLNSDPHPTRFGLAQVSSNVGAYGIDLYS